MRNLLHAAAILSVIACTNDVAVTNGPGASTAGPEETRLESTLIAQCRTICEHLSACPGTGSQSCSCNGSVVPTDIQNMQGTTNAVGGAAQDAAAQGGQLQGIPASDCVCRTEKLDFNDCFKDCVDEVSGRFLTGGEVCAKAGADALACFAGLSCAELSARSESSCGFNSAADLCPKANSDAPTSSQIDPTQIDQAGDSDTAPVGGPVTGAGGAPTGNVYCQDGEMTSFAATLGKSIGTNQQICDSSLSSCSDGHTYRVFCGTDNALQVNCFCVFDGRVQVMFENPELLTSSAPTSDCQDTNMWNLRCGWSFKESINQYE